jgi:hypothetical protein
VLLASTCGLARGLGGGQAAGLQNGAVPGSKMLSYKRTKSPAVRQQCPRGCRCLQRLLLHCANTVCPVMVAGIAGRSLLLTCYKP